MHKSFKIVEEVFHTRAQAHGAHTPSTPISGAVAHGTTSDRITTGINEELQEYEARILVLGVGGGGGNALARIHAHIAKNVAFAVCNTDVQDLNKLPDNFQKLHIGARLTQGLGAGGVAENGKNAAIDSRNEIRALVENYQIVFIACGLGGGTGSGAVSEVVRIIKECGAIVFASVTTPFQSEGNRKQRNALAALHELKQSVDGLVVIDNDSLVKDQFSSMIEAFAVGDKMLGDSISTIINTIQNTGYINADFADVREALSVSGEKCFVGVGEANGDDRVTRAVDNAFDYINVNLLQQAEAEACMCMITTHNMDLSPKEMGQIHDHIKARVPCVGEIGYNPYLYEFSEKDKEQYGEALEGLLRIAVIITGIRENTRAPNAVQTHTQSHDNDASLTLAATTQSRHTKENTENVTNTTHTTEIKPKQKPPVVRVKKSPKLVMHATKQQSTLFQQSSTQKTTSSVAAPTENRVSIVTAQENSAVRTLQDFITQSFT